MLKRECNLVHKAIIMEQRTAPDPTSVYKELASLKEQVCSYSHSTNSFLYLVLQIKSPFKREILISFVRVDQLQAWKAETIEFTLI